MTIKPVEEIPAPKYPDKYNEEIRRVLAATKPRSWLGSPLATGMLAATVALSLSGCVPGPAGAERTGAPPSGLVETTGDPAAPEKTAPKTKPPKTATTETEPPETGFTDIFEYVTAGEPVTFPTVQGISLIPVFEYGEGTGAIGCVAIAAPVFLSEEEAFAVLSAAFADIGMTLSRGGETLQNIEVPVTNIFDMEGKNSSLPTVQGNMDPDATLPELELPVVFVSTQDVESWHEDTTGEWVSVSSFNTKSAAKTLAENNPGIVVFYDPINGLDYEKLMALKKEKGESDEDYYARYDALMEEESQAAREGSESLLRQQAQAFIAWLEYGDEG